MRLIDRISSQKLKELYWRRKMSSAEIAKKFKYSSGFVRNKLREYKIPLRSIQEALPLSNQQSIRNIILAET